MKLVASSLGQEKLEIAKNILGFWDHILRTWLFFFLSFIGQALRVQPSMLAIDLRKIWPISQNLCGSIF